MLPNRLYSRRGERRGTAAVEAALILPYFILFAGAILDLGRLAKATNALANGARNGAQVACAMQLSSPPPATLPALQTATVRSAVVLDMAGMPNLSNTNPKVNPPKIVARSGSNYVQVQVVYDLTGTRFTLLFPVNSLTRTVEMRMMPSR